MAIRWATIRKIWAMFGSTAFLVFTVGSLFAYTASGVDPALLRSDTRVAVTESTQGIEFRPVSPRPVGLIFYPGAMADPHSYVPMARHLADQGFEVRIIELPMRLAPTNATELQVFDRTIDAMSASGTIRRWVVAGHSKGGRLAARFVLENPGRAAGLILVGTSHPRVMDLSRVNVDVTKVYGTRDGLASEEEIKRFAVNLPAATHYVPVEGGNHAQFAYYRFQIGDSKATISRDEQQKQLLAAMVEALGRVENGM